MRHFIFLITVFALLSFKQEKNVHANTIKFLQDSSKKKTVANKKIIKEEKWKIFWKDFTEAIYAKDKKRVAELTSKDFYDGGGGTVDYWLDYEVFVNEKTFTSYKTTLKKGARNFEGSSYKATGKNHSGDLFFEYKNNEWLFGGVVGD